MATPHNIEKFNQLAGKIFVRLYEKFPVPWPVLVSDFGVKLSDDCTDSREIYAEMDFIVSTLKWLKDSGYISYSEIGTAHGAMDAVLTAKGLEVLNAIPDCLEGGESIGDTLIDAVKAGADDAVQDTVKMALSKGIELIPWGNIFSSLT